MIIWILRLHLPLVIPPRENSVTSKQTRWELLLEGPEHFSPSDLQIRNHLEMVLKFSSEEKQGVDT